MIRPARPEDAERLRTIERAAGARFSEVGMTDIAEAEPMTTATLLAYAQAGRSWVVVEPAALLPGLRPVCDAETEQGLDPAARVCMRRAVDCATRVAPRS